MPRWPRSRVDPYAPLKSHHSMKNSRPLRMGPDRSNVSIRSDSAPRDGAMGDGT